MSIHVSVLMSASMCIYLYVCINCVCVHECVTSLHVQLRVDDCTYLCVCAHMCVCVKMSMHMYCAVLVYRMCECMFVFL